MNIRIGSISVPLADYAVGACAVLGIRDSGKTVTSKGIAEQLLDHHIPIVVFDAVGKWRWMKVAGPNGKAYKVVVAGGREPDLPLSPQSIPAIVRAALKERIPLIIDLYSKELSKADWRQIVQQAIHIIHYENEGGAIHVFLEEAAEFVPQRVIDGVTYAEVEKLVRMGGNASVGITLINQRSQEVNKAVLDNCSTALILGCQVGKNAIAAVGTWVEKLDSDTAKEVTTSLPHLKSGEAWVWTRKNLTKPSLEKLPMCRSFHPDRRTPEVVLKSAVPTDTAEFVAKLADSIPKVIEEAKANDPAELKRTITDLKRKLTQAEQKQPEVKQERIEVPVLDDACRVAVNNAADSCSGQILVMERLEKQLGSLRDQLGVIISNADNEALRRTRPQVMRDVKRILTSATPEQSKERQLRERGALNGRDGHLPIGEQKVLRALIQFPDGLGREQLTVLTGYKRSSRDAYIARLREKQLVFTEGDRVVATADGIAELPDAQPLPTGDELQNYWYGRLPQGELAIFEKLIASYPKSVDRESLIESTGYKRSSRDAYIARLRAKELLTEPSRGEVRATDHLFEHL